MLSAAYLAASTIIFSLVKSGMIVLSCLRFNESGQGHVGNLHLQARKQRAPSVRWY